MRWAVFRKKDMTMKGCKDEFAAKKTGIFSTFFRSETKEEKISKFVTDQGLI